MTDDGLERLSADIEARYTEATNERARGILHGLDRSEPVEAPDGSIVLLGFEGQVDGVMRWGASPLPDVVTCALPQRPSLRGHLRGPAEGGGRVQRPEARYRRVGESTYRREPPGAGPPPPNA